MRRGRAIGGKWRILMGRKGSGLIWNSELQGGSHRLCLLRPVSIGSEWTSIWNVLTHMGHIESPNWVASCAAEIEAILPYLMGVQWYSAWSTHGVFTEAYEWKTCTRVRWALIISLTVSWTIATCGTLWACVCHVIRFIPLQGWPLIRISATPSNMGDGLFATPKCSNSTFIMLLIAWDGYQLLGSQWDD
jgi:hypothetical protein